MIEIETTRVYNLGPVTDIPAGEGRSYALENTRIAVFRTRGGEVFATQAACPHRDGPLADGLIGPRQVVCPLHAYTFDLATGAPRGADCPMLKTYPVAIDAAGHILLWLSNPERDAAAGS